MNDLYQLSYSSLLSANALPSCVAQIVKVARRNNKLYDLTGILVFDGQRFFQFLEGPQAPLDKMLHAIKQDTRHEQFQLKHYVATSARHFDYWSMGYALDTTGSVIDTLCITQTDTVVEKLIYNMRQLEVDFA